RPANRTRAEPPRVRASRCHPERRLADSELGDDVVPLADPVQDSRSERFGVERDGLASAINPQLRLDTCHSPTVAVQADSACTMPHAECLAASDHAALNAVEGTRARPSEAKVPGRCRCRLGPWWFPGLWHWRGWSRSAF